MSTPGDLWDRYAAAAKPRRALNAAGASSWLNWTQYPDHGPDESVLGPIDGNRVAELGSGSGANLAHLATLGAHCTGVDIAPSRTAVAMQRWGGPNVEFVTADATAHLAAHRGHYDIVYSIFGAVWFTSPALLLPVARDALVPGGVLAFSHLPAGDALSVGRVITKYELSIEQWQRALNIAGFDMLDGEVIPAPASGQQGTLFIRARRAGRRLGAREQAVARR